MVIRTKMSSYKSVHDLIMLTHHTMLLLTSFLIVAWSCNIAAVLGFSASSRLSHNKLHLITFDLDDTIFPIGPVVADANEAQLARLKNLGYTNANNDEIIKASKIIRTELREAGKVLSYTDLRKQSIKREIIRVTNLQTHQVDESVVNDVFNSWLSMRHESADKNLFDNCVDALEAIRQQHPDAVIGAITNGRGNPLCMPSVEQYFDFCVSGEDEHVFPKRKPDRGIYEAALDTFFNLRRGDSIPEDSLNWIHVGDDLANDVGASAVCGAKAIWLSAEDDELDADLPSWSTATKEELERRAKLNDSAKEYVSAKIRNLIELEKAVLDILTSNDND